jgi:alpha-mannosidase
MALVPTLTITDTTTFSDEISFSVTDELTTAAPSQSLTKVDVASGAVQVLFADSGSDGTVFVYIKNTNTSNSYSIDIQSDNANAVYATLNNGEFAWIPIDANVGVQVYGIGGTVTVEYAYWTRG